MINLLRIEFKRWIINKYFVLMAIISVLIGINSVGLHSENIGWYIVFYCVFIMIFMCIENSSIGYRNKIIAGYSRKMIFAVEWITAVVSSSIWVVLFVAATIVNNAFMLKLIPVIEMVKMFVMLIIIFISITSLALLFSVMITNKWVGIIACVVILFLSAFIGVEADFNENKNEVSVSSIVADVIPFNSLEETFGMYSAYYDSWKYRVFEYGIKIGVYNKQPLSDENNKEYMENGIYSIVLTTLLAGASMVAISKKDFK